MKQIKFLATDNIILDGFLYNANQKTDTVILAIHGMSSNCFKKRDIEISKKANENNIDYFSFNNRGSELVKYIYKKNNGKKDPILAGTSYENVLEGYEDIKGAVIKLLELGYKNIYLQGHSLGSTKIVYTYNKLFNENSKLLENIKGIILLSLIDIVSTLKFFLNDNYDKYLEYAQKLEKENRELELMPREAFIHPISVKTFLRYIRDNKEIDFAKYDPNDKLDELNNIKIPLFMRWGNDNELILQPAEKLVEMINEVIKNPTKDIDYIDGANHGYEGKERELAEQIIKFIKNNCK